MKITKRQILSLTRTKLLEALGGLVGVLLVLILFGFSFAANLHSQVDTTIASPADLAAAAQKSQSYRKLDVTNQLLQAINNERASANLSPLVANSDLAACASRRDSDMYTRHYFSHYDPDTNGLIIAKMRDDNTCGNWLNLGENLAEDISSDSVVEAWINSPEHKAIILNPRYTSIGIEDETANLPVPIKASDGFPAGNSTEFISAIFAQ